ncbi:ImmA/IrrE family metallo-endopeptidase [Clostridium baratii]|uniref:ImmA/IrrE family metallo-endopeptidase n=1 Tax=Clostridium baratii TaxID=1561 RepID=UPI0030CBA13C
MAKFYKGKTKEEKEKEVDKLLEKANKGIEKSFNSLEGLKELIEYMNKFYNYSMRNTFLIQEQFRGALAVGSYAFWKEKGYTVNKGEKGIGILVPIQLSDYIKTEYGKAIPIKKATKEQKELIEKGEIEVFEGGLTYKKGYVFDISQTNAKIEDLPKIFPNKWIEGEVENYDLMYRAMENIANKIGVKIVEPKNELGVVKGVSYPLTREIALNPRNTQLQNVKTLIHELTHAKLHTMETRNNYTKNEKEFQAEMAAYVVCSYFGLDTEEYSFEYINSWIKNAELKDKENLVNEIRNVSKEYIEIIEETLINDKDKSLSLEDEKSLEKKKKVDYDKNLYEIKEQEVMNNSIKDIFKNLKENVMSRVNEIIGKDNKNINSEKELRELEKEFIEAEKYLDLNKDKDLVNEFEEELDKKEISEYGYNDLKEIFKKEMEKHSFEEQILEEFFDYTFDIEKINSEIKKQGLKNIRQNMISACLYSDSISENGDKVSYSDVVLINKDIVKDNIIELVENKNLSYDEVIELVSLENERHKDIEELTLDDIGIKTPVVDRYDREQFLKFDIDDLMKKYSDEISDNRQKFMEKRGLQLRGFVEEFLQTIKEYEFVDEEDYLNLSFERFLDEEIEGYALMEQEEFEEETYMDRLERQSLGEEEYLKTYGKNNVIDSYVPYYVRAYIVYENIDKDKLYEVSNDISLNDKKIESGEVFNIDSYKQGRFIIEFPNRNIKENISFAELQSISNGLGLRINKILELEKYFNDKNVDKELRKELNKDEKFIELLDKKLHLENNIINLKEDIKYYSNESQYNSLDEMKDELKLNEELSSFISKEINLVVGSEIEEVKYKEKEYIIKSDIKLEDGSFIKNGTSFFIEEFKEDNFKVHFENREDNIYINNAGTGEGYYFSENEILRYSDLSKTKDLIKEKNIEKERPLQKDLSKNNSFSSYKKVNYYDVNRLKEIPIKEVCEQLGLEFEKESKDKLWTKIRNEKSSFCCINLDKNYWYDFGLGYCGDTIKLVQEVKGITPKEAIKELAEMFGIEGENVKNNFYLSKDDYKLIGIEPDRATLNLDINLEKQSIEEMKEIEMIYGRSMNELANYDKDKFLEIIKEKSIPILIGDKEKLEIVNDRINNLEDKSSKDGTIYYGMLVALSEKLNTRIEIIEKIGLNKEMDKNNIYKIDEKEIEEFKIKSQELKVGEVKILKSENKIFRENEIMDFRNANEISNYEELRIRELKREYEKEDKYYPYEKVKGKVKISENETIVFRYDIGEGKFNNLADLLERELSNVNNQYTINDFLIEQGVRENDIEEKGINFINDNFIYDKESELER